ncbi:MAG: hypothetical protein GIW99_12795 [Candidatus Eremiobacteraeota bacterium]|nr:hypothetical protein [Candidatus Eremiobacteraeota bacterium]MBC5828537.1 hypothetical protein [Candidatus Eremiobacteraeota bacterium]
MDNHSVSADVVSAKRFQLLDDDGEMRALLKTSHSQPIMQFMDDHHKVKLDIRVKNNWPVMQMHDSEGHVRVEFGLVNDKPTLFFNDQHGVLMMGLALSKAESTPRLVFLDEHRNVRFGVVLDQDGSPRVVAADHEGRQHRLMWFTEPAKEAIEPKRSSPGKSS